MKKSFEKLFKKREDGEVLDPQALAQISQSELIQIVIKYDSEAKEKLKEIENLSESNKQAKRDYARVDEELKLYKSHCEELQNLAKKSSGEAEDFKTLLESRAQEIKYFRDRNSELEKQAKAYEETAKLLDEIEESKTKLKTAYDSNDKLQEDVDLLNRAKNKLQLDYNLMLELLENSNKKKAEIEVNMKRNQEELDKNKKKTKALRQSDKANSQKAKELEAQLKGKEQRIKELEEGFMSSSGKINDKVSALENLEKEFSNYKILKENELTAKNEKIEELEIQMKSEIECEVVYTKARYQKQLDEAKTKVIELEAERSHLIASQSQLTTKVKENEILIQQLKQNLDSAQNKRKLARSEVLRLNQRIEQLSSELKPTVSLSERQLTANVN